MTYLQLVNRVLTKLREDNVSYVGETSYSSLVGALINETKTEVEDAWNWGVLRNTIRVSTIVGTFRYILTGAGNRFRVLNVINDPEDLFMTNMPSWWMTMMLTSENDTDGTPMYYGFNGGDDNGDPYVDVYHVPDDVYEINFNLVIPQEDLSNDTDTLKVPSMPVILGAYARAVSERGEDGGTPVNEADNRYHRALGDAVAFDLARFEHEVTAEVE